MIFDLSSPARSMPPQVIPASLPEITSAQIPPAPRAPDVQRPSQSTPSRPQIEHTQPPKQSVTRAKGEAAAFIDLERYTRQCLITFFDVTRLEEVVQRAFPGLTEDEPIWAEVYKVTARNFKQWRNRVLRDAVSWINQYLALDENVEVADVQDFKELKSYVTRHLEDHWLQEVFVFASKHIMFGKISPTGLAFLRCKLKQAPREWVFSIYTNNSADAFIMLVTTAYFHQKHSEAVNQAPYVKYTREYYCGIFDNLSQKKEFCGRLTVDDFPLRNATSGVQTRHGVIDLDEDSDGVVDGTLFSRPFGQGYDGANDLEDNSRLQFSTLYLVKM